MAEAPRQSAFMPTIKCSNCGNQIEISMMGEHICAGANAAPEPPPPMPDLLGGAFSSLKANVFDKFARAAPPAVDTSAANQDFAKPDQLTPASASTGSQVLSPTTPTNGRPGAGSTGDDYFAPAIAGSPRRPGGYGGFSAEPEMYEADATYGTSPNNKQSGGLSARMDNIAPGPFGMNRRVGSGSKNAFPRSDSRDDISVPTDDSLRPGSALDRPGTAASNSSTNSGSVPPPRVPRNNGYGGFGPPQRDDDDLQPQPLGLGKRSETFPEKLLKSNNDGMYDEAPERVPSAPGPRPDRLRRPSSNKGDRPVMTGERSQRPSFGMRDTSRPPPPRKSLIRPPTHDGKGSLSINLADEFGVGNPYHSPSISQSSSNSGFSRTSQASHPSSNTSPARSTGSHTGTRRPSDPTGFDSLLDDLQTSMQAMGPKNVPPMPRIPPSLEKGVEPLRIGDRRPPQTDLRLDPAVQGERGMRVGSPLKSPTTPDMLSDRMDPAIQGGQSRPPPSRTHSRQPSRSRGSCKACSKAITGKSISSADGRLTGRYHKACFVCATCQEPFTSATFYVLNDKPYCEQHYHKLNGSLCGSCNKGIEGQYLEDEAPKKYHPGCFRCGDCGLVLRDGYFDVNGRVYCERDAARRMQSAMQAQQPPRTRAPPSVTQAPQPRTGAREIPVGLPSGPASKMGPGPLNRPFGLPTGNRLAPGQALRRGGLRPAMPRMEKRMTRLGMM